MRSEWNPRRMHVLEAFEQQIEFARTTGNTRLMNKVVLLYIYGCHEQLEKSQKVYHKELRRKLQNALKLGQEYGCFPKGPGTLWAYEEAYPCKIFWWLRSKFCRAEK